MVVCIIFFHYRNSDTDAKLLLKTALFSDGRCAGFFQNQALSWIFTPLQKG
jgi:hypothetical protein